MKVQRNVKEIRIVVDSKAWIIGNSERNFETNLTDSSLWQEFRDNKFAFMCFLLIEKNFTKNSTKVWKRDIKRNIEKQAGILIEADWINFLICRGSES